MGGGGHKGTQDLGSHLFLLQLGSQAGVYTVLSVAGTQSLGGGMLGPLAPEQDTQPDAGALCLQGGGKALPAYGAQGGGGDRDDPGLCKSPLDAPPGAAGRAGDGKGCGEKASASSPGLGIMTLLAGELSRALNPTHCKVLAES